MAERPAPANETIRTAPQEVRKVPTFMAFSRVLNRRQWTGVAVRTRREHFLFVWRRTPCERIAHSRECRAQAAQGEAVQLL